MYKLLFWFLSESLICFKSLITVLTFTSAISDISSIVRGLYLKALIILFLRVIFSNSLAKGKFIYIK